MHVTAFGGQYKFLEYEFLQETQNWIKLTSRFCDLWHKVLICKKKEKEKKKVFVVKLYLKQQLKRKWNLLKVYYSLLRHVNI